MYYVITMTGSRGQPTEVDFIHCGFDCQPREGHLVLESEGAPVDFRGLKLRELP